jgi:hypothetical protein
VTAQRARTVRQNAAGGRRATRTDRHVARGSAVRARTSPRPERTVALAAPDRAMRLRRRSSLSRRRSRPSRRSMLLALGCSATKFRSSSAALQAAGSQQVHHRRGEPVRALCANDGMLTRRRTQ